MKIKTLEIGGFHSALHGMRNPMDSWEKSDSRLGTVGRKDMQLSHKLAVAGTEHCKHLRMVQVWCDITAPRYWWTEFDTYRVGVEKVSCSTMHTLMKRPLTLQDFEPNEDDCWSSRTAEIMCMINELMEEYHAEEDAGRKKYIWNEIIRILPQSFLQTRTVMMSYAALRNIYRQREGHKLREWSQFREWAECLPESWMITDVLPVKVGDAD